MDKNEDDRIAIEVPVWYLIQLAVYGDMGTGKIPKTMQNWAQNQLNEHGYDKVFKEEQNKRLKELLTSIHNVIGDDGIKIINDGIADAVAGITMAVKLNKQRKDGGN
jgi:hypothetical protein